MKQDGADKLNDLMDECIDHICDDNATHGAESLAELAHVWARAGMGKDSFNDLRQYIINSAIDRLGKENTLFVQNKVQLAEQSLMKTRNHTNGHSIIIN